MLDTATITSSWPASSTTHASPHAAAPLLAAHPGMTIDDGYAIQRAWVALELADGRCIKGRKIGLTSRAMQLSSQIDEPDYAPLMDDMFFAQGGDIPSTASSRRASRSSWPSSWAGR
jgi:2-keto-4-pentenoate hydratase